jgi:ribosomal 50S subunit-associated protein YjgA (DUF615 family)
MAWEWASPVATAVTGTTSVVLVWLTASQGRRHIENLARYTQLDEQVRWLRDQRRDAYLEALQLAEIEAWRMRFEAHGDDSRLEQLENRFPPAEIIEMRLRTFVRMRVFGSLEVLP